MSFRNSIKTGAAMCIALLFAGPVQAQSGDDIGVEILQLLVDEGVIAHDKAQQLMAKARQQAELRKQREAPVTASTIDVPYVPQATRDQIKDEVKKEVMAEAKTAGWVAPNTLPDWVERIKISGDFRARYQAENFSKDNFPFFPDVNAINQAGGVIDAEGFPLLNSTVDRHRFNYRARLGVEANITEGVRVGLRLGSGSDNGAISTNETLGDYFQKDDIWIDRAYVELRPFRELTLAAGRMPNPFFSTDMIWDADINPEGVAAMVRYPVGDQAVIFASGGYFPLQEREIYSDRYMIGGQIGTEGHLTDNISLKAGVAYYDYHRVQSRKNPPDGSRLNDFTAPPVLSKGNSVFNIRTDGLTTLAGLASDYDLLTATISAAYESGPLQFRLTGEAVRNLSFDATEIALLRGEPGVEPGDLGWQMRFDAGYPRIDERGQWRFAAAYKRVETDAVFDIFTDSDFGLGGTDVKGYVLEGEVGVFRNTSIGFTWLSTDAISRPPFSVDVLQLNLNTRF